MRMIATILSVLALAGCATAPPPSSGGLGGLFGPQMTGKKLEETIAKVSQFPLGSEKNPVRADFPPGQRAYLARLRCADGKAPTFARIGSAGIGPYGNIVDIYDVRCDGSEPAKSEIWMDMYHKRHVEKEAVPGFTIVAS